jgi:methionyl-tRNA formyltransferase
MRIVFLGTPDFAVATLRALHQIEYIDIVGVITAPDSDAGRKGKNISAVKQYALDHGLYIMQPLKLKNPEFLAELKSLNADIQVVVAFRMLPELVWNMPPMGTINLHGSLLPKYRGAAPINWAIINGEKTTGVTTFKLKHEIDTGDILFREEVPINETDNATDLHDRMKEVGAHLMVKTIDALRLGQVQPLAQLSAEVSHAPKLFTSGCQINFNLPAQQVHRFIMGLSYHPGAWTHLNGKVCKILRTAVLLEQREGSVPGTIITNHKDQCLVATIDGYLQVLELQLEGKRRMKIDEFLNGWKDALGQLN